MSNKIYDEGFYNEYQKKRYLKTLPAKSVVHSVRILSRAKTLEETYGTDLYNFNLEQCEMLLNYLEPSTLASSKSNYYIVTNYIRWAIEQDLRYRSKGNLNPLELMSDSAYLKKFIDKDKSKLYTKDEIDQLIKSCHNAQDSVVISLLFSGINGNGYDELLNLKRSDLQPNYGLRLQDGENIRYVRVSEECYKLIEKAIDEKTYLKKNGIVSPTIKAKPEIELIENEYVLRSAKTKVEYNGKGDSFLVLRRIKVIKEYNDLDVLTPHTIRNSGMLWMAKQLYDSRGKLDKEEYEEISEVFNISKITNNGYEVYNYHRFKADFLNVKTIQKYYPE